MPAVRLACFDLDNTLIDRQAAFSAWASAFCAARGLGEEAVALLVRLDQDGFATREEVFGPARQALGLTEDTAGLIARYRVEYPRFVAPAAEAARELARLRAQSWRVALVTNGPTSQHDKLACAGLAAAFDALVVSAEVGVEKPNRAIFAEAARRCGTSLEEATAAFMVGDAPATDVGGAWAAGMRTVWMRRGRRWPLRAFRPDHVADDVAEAVDAILGEAR
ncbi:MAG: HAD family hydrolase [Actinomycetota bacterium]|nr:HAD family hydrolase [Actinomycetota bacterium]